MEKVVKERLERVARIYRSNREASRALGMAPESFARACRRYRIDTPYKRQMKRRGDR